jgi:signal transduction histidine kinase
VIRPEADAKGVSIDIDKPTTAVSLRGDAGRLQQVFWNLLANAVKFTPRGGHVGVVIREVNGHAHIRLLPRFPEEAAMKSTRSKLLNSSVLAVTIVLAGEQGAPGTVFGQGLPTTGWYCTIPVVQRLEINDDNEVLSDTAQM